MWGDSGSFGGPDEWCLQTEGALECLCYLQVSAGVLGSVLFDSLLGIYDRFSLWFASSIWFFEIVVSFNFHSPTPPLSLSPWVHLHVVRMLWFMSDIK